MNYNNLKNIILNRRSIRKFKDEVVPRDVLEELIDCARWAPSSTNTQPWKFIGITNKKLILDIAKVVEDEMQNLQDKCIEEGKRDVALKLKAFSKYCLFFKDAPCIIICLTEPYKSKFGDEIISQMYEKEISEQLLIKESIKSASLAVQNILLAAYAMGYGVCPMSAPTMMEEKKVKELVGIEDKYSIMLILALGKPDEEVKPTPRKSVSEIFQYIG